MLDREKLRAEFREYLNETNENYIKYKKELEELLKKKFPNEFKYIVGIGSTIDVQFDYKNKKEAQKSSNVSDINKVINGIVKVSLNKSSKDYKNGVHIESDDWQKDSDEDPHSLFVSFK